MKEKFLPFKMTISAPFKVQTDDILNFQSNGKFSDYLILSIEKKKKIQKIVKRKGKSFIYLQFKIK